MCRGTEYPSPHGIPTDLLDRSLIIRTVPYSMKEMITILSIRAVTEGIELADDALAELGSIAARTSLRYCCQLLTPASILAQTNGKKVIEYPFWLMILVVSFIGNANDVKEVDELFLDSKRSVIRLTENKEKYLH